MHPKGRVGKSVSVCIARSSSCYTWFRLDGVSVFCEVSVWARCRICEWLDSVYLEGLFEFLSSQTAPGRLHITATQGSSPKELQPNRPPQYTHSTCHVSPIAILTRMESPLGDVP